MAEIERFYPKGEDRGRPPIGLERMLRMYVARQSFGFSDEDIEDAPAAGRIWDSWASTLLKFRRLLEDNKLTERIFAAINTLLAINGLMLKECAVVVSEAPKQSSPSRSR